MSNLQNDLLLQAETTGGLLLYEIQILWDEVREAEPDRDRIRKVDQANRFRAQL
ncbi:hypothetical protein RYX36_036351, partial [Vicia faba]